MNRSFASLILRPHLGWFEASCYDIDSGRNVGLKIYHEPGLVRVVKYGNSPSYAIYKTEDFRIHETNDERMLSILLAGQQLVYFDFKNEAFDGMNLEDYRRHFEEEFGEEPQTDVEFLYFEILPDEYRLDEE